MHCDDLTTHLAEYLAGTLPDDARDAVRAHLGTCAACRTEVSEADQLWHLLGALPPTPADSDSMRTRFRAMLEGYTEGARHDDGGRGRQALGLLGAWRLVRPVAVALSAAALVLLGVAIGRGSLRPAGPPVPDAQYAALRQELHAMRQMLTLSLLQQRSASERLKGVRWTEQLDEPDTEVVSALLDALAHDSSVNVRLGAVEALQRFGEQESVKRRVVSTLETQTSPLVQIALIDFALEAEGPASSSLLRRLSEDTALHETVRARAARGLQRVGAQP